MKRRSPAQQHILTTRRDWIRRLLAAFAGTVAFVTQPAPMVAQSCQDWFRCNQWGCLCSCRGSSDYAYPPEQRAVRKPGSPVVTIRFVARSASSDTSIVASLPAPSMSFGVLLCPGVISAELVR